MCTRVVLSQQPVPSPPRAQVIYVLICPTQIQYIALSLEHTHTHACTHTLYLTHTHTHSHTHNTRAHTTHTHAPTRVPPSIDSDTLVLHWAARAQEGGGFELRQGIRGAGEQRARGKGVGHPRLRALPTELFGRFSVAVWK